MTRDHASIDERLAARALGGLDDDEAVRLEREMTEHGDCAECRRLEVEHLEVAGMLPLALEPRPVNDRILEAILPEQHPGADRPARDFAVRREARLGRWQAAFGVAAAIALVLAFALATRFGADGVVPGERFVAFEGGEGDLAIAYTPGERGVVVWGTGLPDPGSDRVYELWLIEGETPTRAACLAPRDGAVAAYVDADPGDADLAAVTVEAPACPDAPTTEPVYTAELA